MEDAQLYFEQIVEPALADFASDRGRSRHMAFLACVALAHTVDYLVYNPGSNGKPKTGGKLTDFKRRSRAFRVVETMANAFKHVLSDGRPNERLRQDQLKQTSRGGFGTTVLGPRIVRVELTVPFEGQRIDLVKAIDDAACFLRQELGLMATEILAE